MGRAAKLKAARRTAEAVAKTMPPPVVDKYAGAKWWHVLLSIVWPKVLNGPRAKVQAEADKLDAMAKKNAIKKVSHALAADDRWRKDHPGQNPPPKTPRPTAKVPPIPRAKEARPNV